MKKQIFFFTLIILIFIPFSILFPQSSVSYQKNNQPQKIILKKVGVEQGLSEAFIYSIMQDSKGFIWIGTDIGLFRYDGYKYKRYSHDPSDLFSISSNDVFCILEDDSGILWIGTHDGLNEFNRSTGQFKRYKHNPEDPKSLSTTSINKIAIDGSGLLWMGSRKSGVLNSFDREKGQFTRYYHDPGNPKSISRGRLRELFVAQAGDLWIGFNPAFMKFNHKKKNFTRYQHSTRKYAVEAFYEDSSGGLWLGAQKGLIEFDRKKESLKFYDIDSRYYKDRGYSIRRIQKSRGMLWLANSNSLYSFNLKTKKYSYYNIYVENKSAEQSLLIYTFWVDNSGNLWIGTTRGLYQYRLHKKSFTNYFKNLLDSNNKDPVKIHTVFEDRQGNLWFGTYKEGIYKINKEKKLISNYTYNRKDPNSLNNNNVMSIFESESGLLWIGAVGQINIFDPESGEFENYGHKRGQSIDSYRFTVITIFESREENDSFLWFGGYTEGLLKFNQATKQKTFYKNKPGDKTSLSDNSVTKIYKDRDGFLWIGTYNGLNKFNLQTGHFTRYYSDPKNNKSINNNIIWTIHESKIDNKDILWIGTSGGLNKFDRRTATFESYTEKDGLCDNTVLGILEDEKHNLWLSTLKGLSKFNYVKGSFKNYDIKDGLSSNVYIQNSCLKTRSGEMIFGGNSITSFFPDKIKDNTHIPPIVITGFQLFNKVVSVKPMATNQKENEFFLPTTISETKEITLSYEKNFFTFEFAALDFHMPQKNKYAYKMEGVDQEWVHTDASRRFANYTNLNPGDYIFRVKGSNNDGIWNETGASINVIILAPWWATKLAYSFYIIFILSAILTVWRLQTNRLKVIHQMEIDHLQTEKLQEVDQMKSRFFANISHEFRTPLTLILGPVEQMLSGNLKANLKEQYKMIIRNGRRLLQLINQLLDLSKLESGKLKLQAREINIISLTNELVQAFESLAVRKNINLKFNTELESQQIYMDVEKFETIINNLVSNAFKFTPAGGKIEVNLTPLPLAPPLSKGGTRGVQISVSNTGPGIPSNKINKIFDRFYQVDETYAKDEEGSGIGLALTKELVELHHGQITVESEAHKKTVFTILLPLGKTHLQEDEIIETASPPSREELRGESKEHIDISTPEIDQPLPIQEKSGKRPVILIVEDNADLRQYIIRSLDSYFQITEAENGELGLNKAINEIPDLIISDVMMPVMDGFEFCTKIKTDERTSHIPVILLTARAAQEDKIEGLETGADDYLAKPFDINEILIRAKNLIEQRRKLRERFSRDIFLSPEDMAITSADEAFLKKAITIIRSHLKEPQFNVNVFSKEIGFSRSQLHRKMLGLTNKAPNHFIRMFRLHHAKQLLDKKSATVSEIAYESGFNNLSYFARCFKEQFGKNPSDVENN